MARTARQLAALGVTIAFGISQGGNLSLSLGLGQAELGMGIELDGKKLFEKETFGGNGRTCQTCHSKRTGTLTLDNVKMAVSRTTLRSPNRVFVRPRLQPTAQRVWSQGLDVEMRAPNREVIHEVWCPTSTTGASSVR